MVAASPYEVLSPVEKTKLGLLQHRLGQMKGTMQLFVLSQEL